MKKNLSKKIISSLLILTFLISAFSVFSFAENTEDSGEVGSNEDMNVLYNRAFDDGWNFDNGFDATKVSTDSRYSIDYEIDALGNYNYFMRAETFGPKESTVSFNFAGYAVTDNKVPGTVIELSVKIDDVGNLGNILSTSRTLDGKDYTFNLLSIEENGHLIVFPDDDNIKIDLGAVGDEWVNVAFAYNWISTEERKCTVYHSYGLGEAYTDKETVVYTDKADLVGIQTLKLGIPAEAYRTSEDSMGMSVCFDNIKIYQGTTIPVDVDHAGTGLLVNTSVEKTIEIIKSASYKNATQLLEESLAMKLGVDYALVRNEKKAIFDGTYGAPKMVDGKIMIPFDLLVEYIGFPYFVHPDGISYDITTGVTGATYITLGRKTAAVAGETVELSVAPQLIDGKYVAIALDDIATIFPGWLSLYDDMGLIIVYQDTTPDNLDDNAPIVTRENDLDAMVNIMKRFVFNTVEAGTSKESYAATGAKVYNDAKTNTENFTHPYLMADQAMFNKLAAAYLAQDADATLKAYLQAIVAKADAIYNDKANVVSDVYSGIKADKIPVNVYKDGKSNVEDTDDGYSKTSGRIDNIVEYANILPELALAYQITGNVNYAKLAYDWSVALAGWEHWGPAYFEDLAQVAYSFALSYDWLYNAYVANGFDVNVLAKAIYELGVYDAYNACIGMICDHPSLKADKSNYTAEKDSTNAISTSSMIVASLAILDYVDEIGNEDAYAQTVYLIGNNMKMLIENGLDIYAPDGSYVESATAWERATSKFVGMTSSLMTAAGTDYGLLDVWGVYQSCYYAIHIESSDGLIWNYNDTDGDGVVSGDIPVIDTGVFSFIGQHYGDSNLLAVRKEQIEKGKAVSIFDVIFYPSNSVPEKEELPLDYYMEGIDAYVSRSDWNAGAMYAGLMGGDNDCYGGQLDSGNFIYHNKGLVWFMDLGAEKESVYGYEVENIRYRYYRASTLGQNVITMTDSLNISSANEIPTYGQYSTGGGVITKTFENEHGSYAILDNKDVYGRSVSSALRGMLVTNDRETVVIQDEVTFSYITSFYWIAHTARTIELSEDNKTAYLYGRADNGESYTLRATLISDFELSFQVVDSESTLPNSNKITLNSANYSKTNGGADEYSRSGIQRLVIYGEEMLVATFAIVLEIVEDSESAKPVGYEWTKMTSWMPTSSEGNNVDTTIRSEAKVSDIKSATDMAKILLQMEDVFTDKLESLYKELTLVEYTYQKIGKDNLQPSDKSSYNDYLDYKEKYDEYLNYANGAAKTINNIVTAFSGLGE